MTDKIIKNETNLKKLSKETDNLYKIQNEILEKLKKDRTPTLEEQLTRNKKDLKGMELEKHKYNEELNK